MIRNIRTFIAVAVVAASLSATGAHATGSCAGPGAGGDWASHGGDVSATRSQALEKTINTSNVTFLGPKWTFSVTGAGGTGTVQTTPVEAEGCVFITTTAGFLYAVNVDNGSLAWSRLVRGGAGGVLSAGLEAPAVHDGVVYLNVPSDATTSADHKGPYVEALNAHTGELIWDSDSVATEAAAAANGFFASSVYFDGLIIEGLTNDETTARARVGGFAIVDAVTGAVLKRTYIIPDDEAAAGFGGCSEWSTSAIDPETKMGYVGTGQPANWTDKESEMCNAIVKYNLDRSSPKFGEILGAVKGIPDDAPYADVDFGASPTLLHDADGRQIVADLQKAGQVTAAYTRHMTLAWRTPVSPVGAALGNYTSSATDGLNVFTVGAYPGQLFSLSGTTGLPNWVTPVVSPVATPNLAYANGVVYYTNEPGVLMAFDSSNGVPLFARPIAVDAGGACANLGGGVAVARNKVIAACGDFVAAYGL